MIRQEDVLMLLAVWVVEPVVFIIGNVVYTSSIGEFLIDFKELINVCTSFVILLVAILRYKNQKQKKDK